MTSLPTLIETRLAEALNINSVPVANSMVFTQTMGFDDFLMDES